ncbi:PREDICTED: DNA repair protein REV1 [Papilio polytes]|uniref:DNA repair protein REV1 n=1 Tax=Papilio polytes TaxID=76194 RepID=UPI000675DFDB|nr:PREDICTED: DNA repair protein REV1 [Papilio polytes]
MRRRDEKFPENGFEDGGGYMQVKIAKLEAQFSNCAGKEVTRLSNIFNDVAIYVNGFTKPSADELKELMAQHGGIYHTYQRSNDFIIASNLPDTKVKNMSLSKVVKPEWITDSIAANSLLDYRNYLLYKNSRTQPQLNFNKIIATKIKTDESHLKDDKDIERNLTTENCAKENSKMLDACTTSTTDTKPVLNKVNKNDLAKTAIDPNFITEFYNNSRLHHISQLGAFFKQHVNDLREASDFSFPARAILKSNINSSKLRGKPVAVTHSKGAKPQTKREGVDRNTEFNLYKQKQAKKLGKVTGIPEEEIVFDSKVDNVSDEDSEYGSLSEIASCSYEARAKGIKNGMFMGPALKLCPNLKTIPYDFEGYKEVAYTLYNTIAQYTLDIEAVSCDEMYVDCTELLKDLKVSVQDFALALRKEIKDKTGCPSSTGFGSNRLQSRLATKRAKPDGQFFLTSDLIEDFMFGISLKDLPGVGRQTSQKLESLGHQTCGSLQTLTLGLLQRHLGNKTGAQLFDQCRGLDPNPLTFHTVRKSVSAEVNYGIRFDTNDQCFQFLKQLSAEVHSRMQQFKVLGKCITLKLMVRAEEAPVETAKFMGHGFCNVINKSTNLTNATNDVEIITKEIISLCKKQKIDPKEMRGIGIQISKLEQVITKPNNTGISKFLSKNKNVHNNRISKVENDAGTHCDVKNKSKVEDRMKNPVTPKKKSISSTIKSPKHGLKSSPVKRRGRPQKSLKNSLSTTKSPMDKFLAGEIQVKEELPIKTIPEIKDEKPKNSDSNQDGLLSLSWEKVRELLRAWLDSGQAPKMCDTKMIASYLSKLVAKKDIDKVYILMNFLKRRTHEIDKEIWIEVYNYVLEDVQNSMIAVYGKKLWIKD